MARKGSFCRVLDCWCAANAYGRSGCWASHSVLVVSRRNVRGALRLSSLWRTWRVHGISFRLKTIAVGRKGSFQEG
ncbi:unnamed protein product [Amoebophrya sp. A25]|nr:unnamed protein product [Amoebophrya sp. A25]|eukprot:GSA25T00027089001.1